VVTFRSVTVARVSAAGWHSGTASLCFAAAAWMVRVARTLANLGLIEGQGIAAWLYGSHRVANLGLRLWRRGRDKRRNRPCRPT